MFGSALVFVIVFCRAIHPLSGRCDDSTNSRFKEGNIGEVGYFPWLGILRVHLHDEDVTKIALTGLIYIKEKFAIANADDIVRIPRHVLLKDSKAMFIPEDQNPWYGRVKESMSHPEYEFATINTVALLELLPNEGSFPMTPICIPNYAFNASSELYAIGYTDENQLLEKMIYKLQYVDPALCDEFYNRAGLLGDKTTPKFYQCGFAVSNKENCVWENGMAMTSNSSGTWSLIGLSIKGPGCAAPARFIDLFPYIPWLESAMSLEEVYYPDYGRRAFTEASQKANEIKDIPVHVFFRSNKMPGPGRPMISDPYQFDVESYRFLSVTRIDKDAIIVSKFDSKYENLPGDCSKLRRLVYREITKLVAPGAQGIAYYKLSLYDMIVMRYTCIKIEIECYDRTDAYIYYEKTIQNYQGTATSMFDGTPIEIIKEHPTIIKLHNATVNESSTPPVWRPSPMLRPQSISDNMTSLPIPNINLWVQFIFRSDAVIKFGMFGESHPKGPKVERSDSQTNLPRRKRKDKKRRPKYRLDNVTTALNDVRNIGCQLSVEVMAVLVVFGSLLS